MTSTSNQHGGTLRGAVYYAAAGSGQLFHHAYAPHGAEETNIEFVEHVVEIGNVRDSPQAPSLEAQGASLLAHRSAVRSFYDEAELRRIGYPEVADLVRTATGAARVVVFDHNIRRGGDQSTAVRAGDIKGPVFHIHTDFSDRSAPVRAADVLGTAAPSGCRMAAINVWRPIAGPLRDCPLAICDASSVEPRDLLAADLLYPDRTGQIYYVTFNPAHRWYYAAEMTADEVWIFKNYDSATDGRARFAPHTAFVDPTPFPAVAPRESVEFRTFAFFDD